MLTDQVYASCGRLLLPPCCSAHSLFNPHSCLALRVESVKFGFDFILRFVANNASHRQ